MPAFISAAGTLPRRLYYIFSAVVFAAGFTALYLAMRSDGRAGQLKPVAYTGEEFRRDELLGYAPPPGAARARLERADGSVVYDITYTRNAAGLRVAPHDLAAAPRAAAVPKAVFFGCSFTYGEGVNDAATLPYQFELKAGGRLLAYNFGFHGYGPQQMLLALQSGQVPAKIGGRPALAVYQALADHVQRCAFKYPAVTWYQGPVCRSAPDGKLITEQARLPEAGLKAWLYRFKALRPLLYRTTDKDIETYLRVVLESERIFKEKYGGEFYVLFWDRHDRLSRKVLAGLRRGGHKTILASEVFGEEYNERTLQERYTLRGDRHPNAAAYEKLAAHLLARLATRPEGAAPAR